MATETQAEVRVNEPQDAEHVDYRTLSTGAVVSVVLGIVSAITIPTALTSIQSCLFVSGVPAVGLIVGLLAIRKIRQSPDQYTGISLAGFGVLLSLGFLVGGLSLATYVYATEVPEGYQRVTFAGLKPDERERTQRLVVPPDIMELDGKKVFIKGYMRPPAYPTFISEFLLVRDNNQCCFGDINQVKYYDQVLVELAPHVPRVDYSQGVFRMAGKLKVDPDALHGGLGQPVFRLEADYAK